GILGNVRSGAKATGQPTGRLVRYRPQPYVDIAHHFLGSALADPAPARLGHAMTSALPPAELLEGVVRVLEPTFRLARLVHATAERVVYHAWDRLLKRHVALHTHLAPVAT